ncbi:hypothetical protein RND71_011643 [Anisodus tanguticus]|uniref:F-box domain-containing protein n=1 Tax=Anisodus tanguticus TaxID=243964 RepID=A0AAE1SFB1_9SOLA|nr:hypothetical protein RND71_011643 [Anisodus tanguticus]
MGDQDQFPSSCGDDDGGSESQIVESTTKKIETGIDRISELPDSLIVKILSLVPLTDACRTPILSKRWQYLWTLIDNLIFDDSSGYMSRLYWWGDKRFILFVDNVLRLLRCSKIKKLSLHSGFKVGLSYGSKIDKRLEIALKKKVEDVDLHVFYSFEGPYTLPQLLCSSSSILILKCMLCKFSEDCVLNWTSLKSLTLGYLLLKDEIIEQIMSNCPQLEYLKLRSFCGFNRLHITSPKCRRLQLIDHEHPHCGDWGSFETTCCFEIVAPYVQHLEISGNFIDAEVRLGDLSSVVHAELTFEIHERDAIADKTIAKDLLLSVCSANELLTPSWIIEVISRLKKEDVSLPLLECKQLTINSWISKYSIIGIYRLLMSSPCLENLTILPKNDCKYLWAINIDLMEDNYLSLQENIFKCSLQNLKNAKVISNCCSCRSFADTTKIILEFLKFLLERAINLEKLVIEQERRRCKSCNICSTINISKMIENLLASPRASNTTLISLG